MGNNKSTFAELTADILEEYADLTFLSQPEIISLFRQWLKIMEHVSETGSALEARIDYRDVAVFFPQLEYNPFKDRLCLVFSTAQDGCYSFDDLLDLFSIMSYNCPNKLKANYAFRIFDFDGDDGVGEADIMEMVERLTTGCNKKFDFHLSEETKKEIAQTLLKHLDLESSGTISPMAFEHGIGKMTNFDRLFSFRV